MVAASAEERALSAREATAIEAEANAQMAALDFIACATSDVFAMIDSGSQWSSLLSGFRTYAGGHAPNLRPNNKRLAAILSENSTIGWNSVRGACKGFWLKHLLRTKVP
ncbi:hypothetical protein GH714_003879 [Hevea brasiliensis]|uniref:Uncharacterized protein n=1 Tax=Hevea brasiliensis TaxID=3981 RepID=A0A6A6M8H8_HEVBR|nr:hypothetical protein GH714_003879 [Hevea brasiliensis]